MKKMKKELSKCTDNFSHNYQRVNFTEKSREFLTNDEVDHRRHLVLSRPVTQPTGIMGPDTTGHQFQTGPDRMPR